MIDYDYSKDLDESRQTSKPYPSTPEVWPRNKAHVNETVSSDEDDDDVLDEGLTETDIILQKEISEEFKSRAKAFYEKHGQRTVSYKKMISRLIYRPFLGNSAVYGG